ncbi:uncharacterized protein LOC135848745 [Planococcus citri]|uniref:uncharacterized protein LOC135848745 n=1 Tax=Planococcus citri TaxID=170843 RepID=UPI0031F9603F
MVRKLEMDEIIFGVYDVINPTPASLQELSAISVSLEIWRNELRINRKIRRSFSPRYHPISIKTVLPDLPSLIYIIINQYIARFGASLDDWSMQHHHKIFNLLYTDMFDNVLNYFDDFVCDFNGEINYTRTAERMMHCNELSETDKFIIACTYFFENDIRRIWPSVHEKINSTFIIFDRSPQFSYWVHCLETEWNMRIHRVCQWQMMMITPIGDTIGETVFLHCMPYNRPSAEYIWNRIPSPRRIRFAIRLFRHNVDSFIRFILPKLDEKQLAAFINETGSELTDALLKYHSAHSHVEEVERRRKLMEMDMKIDAKECQAKSPVIEKSMGMDKKIDAKKCQAKSPVIKKSMGMNEFHNMLAAGIVICTILISDIISCFKAK